MKRSIWILIMVLFLLPLLQIHPLNAQSKKKEKGKIGEMEKEIEKENDSDEDTSNDDEDEDEEYYTVDDHSGWMGMLISDIFWDASFQMLVGMLFIFPNEDSLLYNGNLGNVYYSDYPYADPREGLFSEAIGKRFSIELAGHYFYDESELTGIGFRGRLSPIPFISGEVHFTELREQLRSGGEDMVQLYSAFVNYNRLRLERWALWWGLGLTGIRGSIKHTGFAFNVGTEIFPAKPLSLHFSYNGGFLNGRYVPEFFGSLNVHIRRYAFFAGYQYWSAGAAVIDGILGGVKVYF